MLSPMTDAQQLSEHLHALRQEAALARLVPRRLGLWQRLLQWLGRAAQPKSSARGIQTT